MKGRKDKLKTKERGKGLAGSENENEQTACLGDCV